jgi:iron-sulfur cluster assembly protein
VLQEVEMAISLTPAAQSHVRNYLAERGKAGGGLRLGVKPTGCSGLSYVVEIADDTRPDDAVFDCGGVKVMVDRKNLSYLDGTEVDYRREGLNAGFRFTNPNEKATCGCGESFTV